jgi:hypothetical protein
LSYLGSLDDDGVCRQVDPPGQCGSGHQHLDVFISKQFFHESPVHPVHARVVDGKAIGKKILKLNVLLEVSKEKQQ